MISDLILNNIKEIALSISKLLATADFKYSGSSNSTGDSQLSVDIMANSIFRDSLLQLDAIKGICSEEEEDVIFKDNGDGKYIVAFDPLDGSSIAASNLSVGSIFGVYCGELHPSKLVMSGYIIYGPRLEMVVAKDVVQHYLYNGANWTLLSNLSLKDKGNINATGGTQKCWSTQHKMLIESFFLDGYRLRYSGGMVPDLHNILYKGGGLFSYPATTDAPNGKLRALFEVFPFAFIFERAGGEAISCTLDCGIYRILDVNIDHIHQSVPCFFGSKYEISQVKLAYKQRDI